jgi:sugar O-acyltransferase (sialic acid O-acetyltransferase NeuD family)
VRPIVIVGAGGMGREALAWLADTGRAERVVGFIDEAPQRAGTVVAGLPILGTLDVLAHGLAGHSGEVEAVLAIGAPRARLRVMERCTERSVVLGTVVHPTATVGPRTTLGAGAIVCPQVVLTCDVSIGRGAIVNFGAMVGHDSTIGQAAFVAPGANLAGNVTVGPCASVGIGSSVVQGVTIGEEAVVGAGAVVVHDVDPGVTVVGVPARPIRQEPR